jgi:aldose 1-epimerase
MVILFAACQVIYRLEAGSGLHVFISAPNIGDQPAPYGSGAIPI